MPKLPPGWLKPEDPPGLDVPDETPLAADPVYEDELPQPVVKKRGRKPKVKFTWTEPPEYQVPKGAVDDAMRTNLKTSIRRLIGPNGEAALATIAKISQGIPFSIPISKEGVPAMSKPEIPKLTTQLEAAKFLLLCLHGNPMELPDDGFGKPAAELTDEEMKGAVAMILRNAEQRKKSPAPAAPPPDLDDDEEDEDAEET